MEFLKRSTKNAETDVSAIRETVTAMLVDIENRREAAVTEIAKRLDGWEGPFVLSPEKRRTLMNSVPESVKADIRFAHDQVRAFAKAQRCSLSNVEVTSPAGVRLGQKIIPVD